MWHFISMTSCRTKTDCKSNAESWTDHWIVVCCQWRRRLSACVRSPVLEINVHRESWVRTHGGHLFQAQFVMFHGSVCYVNVENFWIWSFTVLTLLFIAKNVTSLKRFTRFYAGEAEDLITGRLAVVSETAVPKIRAFSCGLMTLC